MIGLSAEAGSIESSRLMIGLSAEAGAQKIAQLFSSCECCCECCCEKCCESLGATSSSSRKKGATGFTGDLAADVGTSLGGLWAHPERRLKDRSGARRGQDLAAALSRESELAEGFADARFVLLGDLDHVELRRLSGRPC
jgi:hypothetical protein